MRKYLLILGSACIAVWLLPQLEVGPWAGSFYGPSLFKYGPHGNMVASAPVFLRALLWGLAAALIAELCKFLPGNTHFTRALVGLFQVSLVIDSVRLNAIDWFGYCLSYLKIAEIPIGYGAEFGSPVAWRFPWISLIPLALTSGAVLLGPRTPSLKISEGKFFAGKWVSIRRPLRLALAVICWCAVPVLLTLAVFNWWMTKHLPDEVYVRRAIILGVFAVAAVAPAVSLTGALRDK